MSRDTSKEQLCKLTRELFETNGQLDSSVRTITEQYPGLVLEFVRKAVFTAVRKDLAANWAEPVPMPPLRLPLSGDEAWVPDRIILVDDEYLLRRQVTFDEAIASDTRRESHHRGEARRAVLDRQQEEHVRDVAAAEGLDVTRTWDQLVHGDTICWRCGEGWRADDPFEGGHVGMPLSKGGTRVEWEHASCNRSARAGVTSEPTG
jgi:hypothetical protein